MTYYAGILLGFRIIGICNPISKSMVNNQGHRLLELLVFLPIIGRVLGWW